jgi:hypothetical protein
MSHQSTLAYILSAASRHSRKIRVDNIFLCFFNHAWPKLKVRPVSPDFWVEADWLKWATPLTQVTLSASRYPLSHEPRSLPLSTRRTPAKQLLLSGGPKAGVCRVSITDVTCWCKTLYKFYRSFLNKNLTSQGSLFLGSNQERAASMLIQVFIV